MASGHRWWFGVPVAATFPYNRAELPAGLVIASAEDMSHYMIAEINDGRFGSESVLSPQGMMLRHTPPPPKRYGFGWEFTRSNKKYWLAPILIVLVLVGLLLVVTQGSALAPFIYTLF